MLGPHGTTHSIRDTLEQNHRLNALQRTRERMGVLYLDNQVLGRRATIGCVALEITQRCNLDCTLCYLSTHSEEVKDIPIEEIFRRIDSIKAHFGAGTDVQITGGDPTLRKRTELIQIVRRIREIGMRPTLMTNGIAATRELLVELVKAGLNDVAFHVDITEQRRGFHTEAQLNRIREQYIERVRGLPLAVVFNTTVCRENFDEIPDLVSFFRKHADVVGMASFQLQADTGRGEWKKRHAVISLDSVRCQIQKGAGTDISWDTILIGHPRCHKIGITLESNGNLYDMNHNPQFFNAFLDQFKHVILDRRDPKRVVKTLLWELIKNPVWIGKSLRFFSPLLWKMKADLFSSHGKIHKLSFFIQNFMDKDSLEPDRLHACSFMVMTQTGPVSMCAHNAKRDDYILEPIPVDREGSSLIWDPLTGNYREKSKPLFANA